MSYYGSLIGKWGTLSGTTAQKLAAINALTVPGPSVDVSVSSVVGYLLLSGGYLPLAAFAQTAATGNTTHDTALAAAKTVMALMTIPNAPSFGMSNPGTFAAVKGMADAILAQETASPGSTGFTQAIHDGLLALCSTSTPWWQSAGYTGPFSQADLAAAGGLT